MQEWIHESKCLYSESSLDIFSGWRYHNSSLSPKSVWVRTLCIWRLPFLLCQSLLRKAEPVENTYLGLFATMVWPFVVVRVVQQSMLLSVTCSVWWWPAYVFLSLFFFQVHVDHWVRLYGQNPVTDSKESPSGKHQAGIFKALCELSESWWLLILCQFRHSNSLEGLLMLL